MNHYYKKKIQSYLVLLKRKKKKLRLNKNKINNK